MSFAHFIQENHISDYYEFRKFIRLESHKMTKAEFGNYSFHLADDIELLTTIKYDILWLDENNRVFDLILANPNSNQMDLAEKFTRLKNLIQKKFQAIMRMDHRKLVTNAIKTGKFIPLKVKKSFLV